MNQNVNFDHLHFQQKETLQESVIKLWFIFERKTN